MSSVRQSTSSSEEIETVNFWRILIDPSHIGMAEAIAEEISAYTGEPIELVLGKMNGGKEEFKQLWIDSNINPKDSANVASFYRDQFIEAYELANWHSGRTNGVPPLSYARAALFARQNGLRRALDFGSGIGTGSLALASVGCEVHSADIASELLKFVGFRLNRRGFAPRLIDLNTDARPLTQYFDIITCFDVLEHVPDQLTKLMELQSYLRFGGYLCVNMFRDSTDSDRPMHISSAGDPIKLIRKTSMKPQWLSNMGEMFVLERTRMARWRNSIAALAESMPRKQR
jgi:2-polyprenyl-3-methyl-5-hydroxy-6-metoxy-1,4-benzoquinol methylase